MTDSKDALRKLTFYKDERLAVFIDGANLHATTRAIGQDFDFRKLHAWLSANGRLTRVSYYTAVDTDDAGETPIRKLLDFLEYNNYTMVQKATKSFVDNKTGLRKIKGNMDIELAIDMLQAAHWHDHIILFSGDGDFRRLVEVVQAHGVRVSVASSIKSDPNTCADELRRQADQFIEIADLLKTCGREREVTHAA